MHISGGVARLSSISTIIPIRSWVLNLDNMHSIKLRRIKFTMPNIRALIWLHQTIDTCHRCNADVRLIPNRYCISYGSVRVQLKRSQRFAAMLRSIGSHVTVRGFGVKAGCHRVSTPSLQSQSLLQYFQSNGTYQLRAVTASAAHGPIHTLCNIDYVYALQLRYIDDMCRSLVDAIYHGYNDQMLGMDHFICRRFSECVLSESSIQLLIRLPVETQLLRSTPPDVVHDGQDEQRTRGYVGRGSLC